MKPSLREMWTSLDCGSKLAILMCSSKKSEKKNVNYLQHADWSRCCRKQNLCIMILSIYMHSIDVTHLTKAHCGLLSLTHYNLSKIFTSTASANFPSLSISQSILIAQNSHENLSCVPASTQHPCWEIQTQPRSYWKETGCTLLMVTSSQEWCFLEWD